LENSPGGHIDTKIPGSPPSRRFTTVALHVTVYVFLYFLTAAVFGRLFLWAGGYLVGITATGLTAALFSNWLSMRIYENRSLDELGLWINGDSGHNVLIGTAGGIASACLVLGPPVLLRAAHFTRTPEEPFSWGTLVFVTILLGAGAAGEELFFRGYGFQIMLATLGPYATILPVGVIFAALHWNNPNAGWLAMINTAGFGILFGYAFLRSRDLWLPIGLHFGWNFTLPLFGVNLSGLRMKVTGYELSWTAGDLWSGGQYGPEASILTTLVLLALLVYIWKAPVRRQPSPLTDPPAETPVCEQPSLLQS
jgi:membrane protease YdiL (CAAX protease family)